MCVVYRGAQSPSDRDRICGVRCAVLVPDGRGGECDIQSNTGVLLSHLLSHCPVGPRDVFAITNEKNANTGAGNEKPGTEVANPGAENVAPGNQNEKSDAQKGNPWGNIGNLARKLSAQAPITRTPVAKMGIVVPKMGIAVRVVETGTPFAMFHV